VTLQVAASSQIISNSVVFEYKARALPALPSSQHDWLSLDGTFLIYLTSCVALFLFFVFLSFGIVYFQQNSVMKFGNWNIIHAISCIMDTKCLICALHVCLKNLWVADGRYFFKLCFK